MTTFTAKSFGAYDAALGRIGPILFMGLSFEWTLGVGGAALYEAWIAAGRPTTPVQPPENQDERTLRLIKEAGLMEPLMQLAHANTLDQLAARAVETKVWDGFKRLLADKS